MSLGDAGRPGVGGQIVTQHRLAVFQAVAPQTGEFFKNDVLVRDLAGLPNVPAHGGDDKIAGLGVKVATEPHRAIRQGDGAIQHHLRDVFYGPGSQEGPGQFRHRRVDLALPGQLLFHLSTAP